MMKEIPYENAFILLKNKTSKMIILWLILSLGLMIIGFCFFFGYSYQIEEEQYAYVEQNQEEYRFITYVKKEEVSSFENYQLKIEEEEIPFQVEHIGQATKIEGDIYYEKMCGLRRNTRGRRGSLSRLRREEIRSRVRIDFRMRA